MPIQTFSLSKALHPLLAILYIKSLNLFGLYENYDSIQKAKQVTVVEAEKSVLKRDSLNDSTLVALSGHTMSEEQAAILIGLLMVHIHNNQK